MRLLNYVVKEYQEQSVVQQSVVKDSLKVNTSLRTPVLEIEDREPAYLRQQTVARPALVRKPVPKLSKEDSLRLNIPFPSKKADDYFFNNSLSAFDPSHETQVNLELPAEQHLTSELDSSIAISNEKELEKDRLTVAKPKFVEEKQVSNHAIARHKTPFEGHKDWMSGLIILTLILAGFIRLTAYKYMNELFSAIRFQQAAAKLFSTVNVQNQKPMVALTALFFLSTALMIFEFIMSFGKGNVGIGGIALYGIILVGLIVFFIIKTLLYRFVAIVFEVRGQTGEYLFNASLLSQGYGIVLLPIVSLVPFVDYVTGSFLLKVGVGLFLLMYMIQLIRGVKIILRVPLSIFYMFLYFCALEILPLSILIKVLMF